MLGFLVSIALLGLAPGEAHAEAGTSKPMLEPAVLQKRMNGANTTFGVGVGMAAVGGAAVGIGAVVTIVGVVPLLLNDNPTMSTVGLYTAGGGAAVAALSLPVMTTGGMWGASTLRRNGVSVTSVPGWVAVAGLPLVFTGLATDINALAGGGLAMMVGGSITQVIVSNRAFRKYKAGMADESTVSLGLRPVVTRQTKGLALVVRY